jgi:hypothetical protein
MALKARTLVPLGLAAAALVVMLVATVANAAHPRPKSGTPIRVSMVPAFNQCTAGTANRTHGPPLVFPSCNPPVQTSGAITVGTPDANGAAANSVGSIKIRVIAGDPATPADEADVELIGASSDIRCKAGTTACGAANAADGADYTGELQGNAQIRITDHWNAVAPGGGPDAATVVDIPFPVTTPCAGTASTAIGSNCNITTTADTVVPGSVKELKRAVVEINQIHVNDGGVDGVVGTDPNTLFGVQGIFIP